MNENMIEGLPTEVLSQICQDLRDISSPKSLANLSRCSKKLHTFVNEEGWRPYCRENFPSWAVDLPTDINYAQVAHSLVSLAESWSRKSILSHFVEPVDTTFIYKSKEPLPWIHGRNPIAHPGREDFSHRRRRPQTIGYQAIVDSQEELIGTDWTSRREFVAYGAGREIAFRIRTPKSCSPTRLNTSSWHVQWDWKRGKVSRWCIWKPEGAQHGSHDVTALKLLSRKYVRGLSRNPNETVCALYSTARGNMSLVHLNAGNPRSDALHIRPDYERSFNIPNPSIIREIDTSPSESMFIAGGRTGDIHLFRNTSEATSNPVDYLCIDKKYGTNLWATKFLTESTIAVGTGTSSSPLQLYTIRPSNIESTPVQTWRPSATNTNANSGSKGITCSLLPMPPSFGSTGASSNLFFTGDAAGQISIFDIRQSEREAVSFSDIAHQRRINGLAAKGREILAAASGSTQGIVHFFDLRYPGRLFPNATSNLNEGESANVPEDWNLFLMEAWRTRATYREANIHSPTYSISSPSPHSPTLYAGLEHRVMELNFVDVYDKHPNPVFKESANSTRNMRKMWDPKMRAQPLAFHSSADILKLYRQQEPWPQSKSDRHLVLDTKWA